ncbi:vacuolar transporter chaperone, putative [Plasmodium vinckei brucechwatti]|uniref:Vacuolar transporter chaperone, putative n=1 Tax=Plasmodium vinckei brucechwatti TaxID=119398 RepID=A0A6V7S9S8_PLAVN|nr:vacuolar transporter chaperone, putative [Plasmodium vinckei brucechwatti]
MEGIPNHYKKYYVSHKKIKRIILKMGKKYKKKLEKGLMQNTVKHADKQGIKMLPPFLYNDIISHEIKKVNKFSENKYNEIIKNLVGVYKELKKIKYNNEEFEKKKDIEKILDLIGCDIIHFDFYIQKNFKIIMKLVFFFDKVMNISINQWVLLSLIKEKFCNINIENLIVYLSFLYSLLRSINNSEINDNGKSNNGGPWVPPDTFERVSTKFLIKLDHIIYTKVKIVKHLPYLIFGLSNDDIEQNFISIIEEEEKKNTKNGNQNKDIVNDKRFKKPLKESQQITSVYFDNEDATCFSKRILRYENAQLIRFRWYNDNEHDPKKTIFIERKTHHEEWTGENSTKERFELEQKYVLKYMTGELKIRDYFIKKLNNKKKELYKIAHQRSNTNGETNYMDDKKIKNLEKKTNKNIKLANEIQKMILNNNLEPIIRTSYLRSAFQQSTDNTVRISIDTNISMLNEYIKKREYWCRLSEEVLGKNEVIRLNYGIIEVKLKVNKMPEWITHILNSNESINLYKYSKYQTAMALLHSEKIKYIPIWVYENIHHRFKSKSSFSDLTIKDSHGHISDFAHNPDFKGAIKNDNNYNGTIDNSTNQYSHKYGYPSNGYVTDINMSAYNTLERMNELEKTFYWINNKYNKNFKESEQINLIKIDPKINFAAERTFLHYAIVSVYITLLALFLDRYKNKNTNIYLVIILLLITSFSSLISSYFFFLKRNHIIQKRKTGESNTKHRRFDSFYSPLILLVLLLISIILSIYFNFNFKAKPLI